MGCFTHKKETQKISSSANLVTMMGSFGSMPWRRALVIIKCLLLTLLILIPTPTTLPAAEDPKPDPSSIEFFEKQVRPLLVKQCISCHGPAQQFSSLRVDSREALLKGGNRGPAIIPGDATLSLL